MDQGPGTMHFGMLENAFGSPKFRGGWLEKRIWLPSPCGMKQGPAVMHFGLLENHLARLKFRALGNGESGRLEKRMWLAQFEGLGGWIRDLAQCILEGWKNAFSFPQVQGLGGWIKDLAQCILGVAPLNLRALRNAAP